MFKKAAKKDIIFLHWMVIEMKREEIMDKLEAYVLIKSILEDKPTWKVRSGESLHEGIKKNNFIRVIEQKKERWYGVKKKWNTYLEILYADNFVTISLFLRPEQKKAYKMLREYFLTNRDAVKEASQDKFTARFEDHDRFDEFFENYILGEKVCNLV
ncbi:MAG: hypothetical protein K0R18_134 [Bacillales bacterium]|nr:hypothetical protein [Bacillales bacterium]